MKNHLTALVLVLPLTSLAGEVEIVDVRATPGSPGSYGFDVTLRHTDTGWDHYADGWEVIAPDGTSLGERTLYHPHVNEQPFTRSLGGVGIPQGTGHVLIRAHDKVHGYTKTPFRVELAH